LIVTAEVHFQGATIVAEMTEQVIDAFGYNNVPVMVGANVEVASALPMHNSFIDVEGNLAMPEGTPFITRVASVSGAQVGGVNMVPGSDKATIEGVMTATVTFECEEKQLHLFPVKLPFSAVIKMESLSTAHNIELRLAVLGVKVKARRGKELLVDARLGVTVSAHASATMRVVAEVGLGDVIMPDDSAILIYTVGANETLWDVAKRITVPTAEILRHNPSAEHGLKAGERLFIYRQQVVNF